MNDRNHIKISSEPLSRNVGQDICKLLHKATLGSKHVASDPESARDRLTRESAEMGDGTEKLF